MPVIRQVKGRYIGSRKLRSPRSAVKTIQRARKDIRRWTTANYLKDIPEAGKKTSRAANKASKPISKLNPYRKFGLVTKGRRRIAGAAAAGAASGAGWLMRRKKKQRGKKKKVIV